VKSEAKNGLLRAVQQRPCQSANTNITSTLCYPLTEGQC